MWIGAILGLELAYASSSQSVVLKLVGSVFNFGKMKISVLSLGKMAAGAEGHLGEIFYTWSRSALVVRELLKRSSLSSNEHSGTVPLVGRHHHLNITNRSQPKTAAPKEKEDKEKRASTDTNQSLCWESL